MENIMHLRLDEWVSDVQALRQAWGKFAGDIVHQYQAACAGTVQFNLSALAKVELSGLEARPFLHNLCTNDVKNLAEGSGCEAFLTTAKARVVAHVFVGNFRIQDQPVLLLDAGLGRAEALVRHLNHYIVSEQVEVADRTEAFSLYRMVGPLAQSRLETFFGCSLGELKHLQHQAIRFPDGSAGFVRRFDGLSLPAFDVIGPKAAISWADKWEVPPAVYAVHECLRVEAGLPEFGFDMDDTRLVMEIGRTAQAICYTKGCFLGQEPIVMARDRGQVNRLLLGVKLPPGKPLERGARLFKGEAEVGQVTSSVLSPRLNQVIALAYLKRGHHEPVLELVVEPATDGRKAIVTALPFIA
jgi:folate-binding protein YgfZ